MSSIPVSNAQILSQFIAATGPGALLASATQPPPQDVGAATPETRDALVLDAVDAARKLSGLDQDVAQIASLKGQLQEIEAALNKLIHACGTGSRGRGCPIIENLSR